MRKKDYLNDTEKKLLILIREHPSVSIDQMSKLLYVHRNLITRYLKRFKEGALIETHGSKKEGYCRKLTNKACNLLTKV